MLLRTLESKELTSIQTGRKINLNVRLICATNEDLNNGDFRNDFYYRIAIKTILIPPLRERKDDIPDLVNHFLNDSQLLKDNFGNDKIKFQIEDKALERLKEYDYPGNVRELKNIIINCMLEAKAYDNVIKGTDIHLPKSTNKQNTSNINENYSDVENFLDQIEKIVVENFESSTKVNIPQILPHYITSKGNKITSKNSFSQHEMTPRAAIIEKLIKENPTRWSNAISKCQFIKNAKAK